MKKELKEILKCNKNEIVTRMTEGTLCAILTEMRNVLTMDDIQNIECDLRNSGSIWATSELIDRLMMLNDDAFRKFAMSLKNCPSTLEVFNMLESKCKDAGQENILSEEVIVTRQINPGSGNNKRRITKDVLNGLWPVIRDNLTEGEFSRLLRNMESELPESDIQRIKCTLKQYGKNRATDVLIGHVQSVASKKLIRQFIKSISDESRNSELYCIIKDEFIAAGLQSLLPRIQEEDKPKSEVPESIGKSNDCAANNPARVNYTGAYMQTTPSTAQELAEPMKKIVIKSSIDDNTSEMRKDCHMQSKEGELEQYKMSSKPTGICLIISNEDFSKTRKAAKGFNDRYGTEIDVQNLTKVFEWLGFTVQVEKNLEALEMWNALLQCKNMDHSCYDCLVVCILSHGQQKGNVDTICGIDGKHITSAEILGLFDGRSCATLVGKPKLFFLQCCRGMIDDAGVVPLHTSEHDGPCNIFADALPTQSDFFIGYATTPGCKSWRNIEKGTWYISKLCEVLEELARKCDFLSMMTKVNNLVSKFYTENGCKQVPNPSITLRKQLYFSPKQ